VFIDTFDCVVVIQAVELESQFLELTCHGWMLSSVCISRICYVGVYRPRGLAVLWLILATGWST